MRLAVEPELSLVSESVRSALAGWEGGPLEPVFGEWWDEADAALAARLAAVGWVELWQDGLGGAAVAGAVELGRAVAPLSLLDTAMLGGALALGGRVRHASAGSAVEIVGGALRLGGLMGGEREATLDGLGTLRGVRVTGEAVAEAEARLVVWVAATLAYLAGLADGALQRAIVHVSSREQFGAPLGALPAVRGRLADAALVRDALLLCAWEAVADPVAGRESLAWGGAACRQATGHALQVHGGIGFALEGGLHRFHRRAKSVQIWADTALAAM